MNATEWCTSAVLHTNTHAHICYVYACMLCTKGTGVAGILHVEENIKLSFMLVQ